MLTPSVVKARFEAAAVKDESGDLVMGPEQFTNAIAPAGEDYHRIHRDQYAVLFKVADRSKSGKLSLSDWEEFETLLSKPDADYQIAFRLFGGDNNNRVTYENVKHIYETNRSPDGLPLDFDTQWMRLHMGSSKHRHDLDYAGFSQMLRGLQGERIRQAFTHYDRACTGYISAEEFERIIRETSAHKLSDHTLEHLASLCRKGVDPETGRVPYAAVRAFRNIVDGMDLVEKVVVHACQENSDGKISQDEFLAHAAQHARFQAFTPVEVDMLFRFASVDVVEGARLSPADFRRVVHQAWRKPISIQVEALEKAKKESQLTMWERIQVSIYNFALGSLAGAFGAFMVYPIDLVKTRMQNQRKNAVGSTQYKNSIDCFQKVVRHEGFLGLYSGVLPQLIGVAPEKAIKLTVNDLVRGYFTKKDGGIFWGAEVLAGGSAGACQVVFTNPLEIVKIRLQIQGEASKNAKQPVVKRNALWIMSHLGFMGLYKGASACLLRDVPFSAIYFPVYSHLKRDLFGETPMKPLGVFQLLTAGAIAGIPAAYLTTPCDVIKTRLQVEARKGDTAYTGLRDAASKIFKEEGASAFFKGGPARIFRSSPQFGFTLAAYEVLQKAFPLSSHLQPPKPEVQWLDQSPLNTPFIASRNALKAVLDIDENFGRISLPNTQTWKVLDKAVEAVYS